jgi:hypothetical protein
LSKIKFVDKSRQTSSPVHVQNTRHKTHQTFNLTNKNNKLQITGSLSGMWDKSRTKISGKVGQK